MKNKIKNIHMIGIGGAGMSGIAEVLLNEGYIITGSDMAESPVVEKLRELGACVYIGHRQENLGDVQVVVKSTAIGEDNPEVVAARQRKITVIPRAEMLAELMRLRRGISVAGTHGKTTTTSLCASIFDAANMDATVIIGGKLNVCGANAKIGHGKYLIAEADESDGSFLCLFSIINIVTNIDADHLDHYGSREALEEAFLLFMNKAPFYGLNVVCGDDPTIRRLLGRVTRPVLTYGLEAGNDLRATILENGDGSRFEVWRKEEKLGEVYLPQPGIHNILNALAAIGVALAIEIPFDACVRGLAAFKGVGRRFERRGTKNGIDVVDDYGHHPAELAATLAAARSVFPGRRIVAAFQPHRYSRTKALYDDFCTVFSGADMLLLTDIYAASEKPIAGITGAILADGIRSNCPTPVHYYPTLDGLLGAFDEMLNPGDVLLTLGAGSITKVGPAWLAGATHA